MFEPFLNRVLTESRYESGCGMSTRPAYYSGRGATTCDLKSQSLFRIHAAIREHKGAEAAQAFVKMVGDIPVLSATDFLLALRSLQNNGFVWEKRKNPNQNGLEFTNEYEAMGAILTAMVSRGGDQTEEIRGEFLRQYGDREQREYYRDRYDRPTW